MTLYDDLLTLLTEIRDTGYVASNTLRARVDAAIVNAQVLRQESDPFEDEEKVSNFIALMTRTCALAERVKLMDDRELLWWLSKIEKPEGLAWGTVREAIWEALETRLYPEYDGDAVLRTYTGWMTPAGPIDYVDATTGEILLIVQEAKKTLE